MTTDDPKRNPYVIDVQPEKPRLLGYWQHKVDEWDHEAEVTIHEDGITISVSQEQAMDSYNTTFTCEAPVPIEDAIKLTFALMTHPQIAAAIRKLGEEP